NESGRGAESSQDPEIRWNRLRFRRHDHRCKILHGRRIQCSWFGEIARTVGRRRQTVIEGDLLSDQAALSKAPRRGRDLFSGRQAPNPRYHRGIGASPRRPGLASGSRPVLGNSKAAPRPPAENRMWTAARAIALLVKTFPATGPPVFLSCKVP